MPEMIRPFSEVLRCTLKTERESAAFLVIICSFFSLSLSLFFLFHLKNMQGGGGGHSNELCQLNCITMFHQLSTDGSIN